MARGQPRNHIHTSNILLTEKIVFIYLQIHIYYNNYKSRDHELEIEQGDVYGWEGQEGE